MVNETGEHTGKSVSYYKIDVVSPTSKQQGFYTAECNDIIEALNMNYAEANVFKAIWRIAAARKGKLKKGNSVIYDAEKAVFFAARVLIQSRSEVVQPIETPKQGVQDPHNFDPTKPNQNRN